MSSGEVTKRWGLNDSEKRKTKTVPIVQTCEKRQGRILRMVKEIKVPRKKPIGRPRRTRSTV